MKLFHVKKFRFLKKNENILTTKKKRIYGMFYCTCVCMAIIAARCYFVSQSACVCIHSHYRVENKSSKFSWLCAGHVRLLPCI